MRRAYAAPMLELRLLGPVEALVDGQPVALPAKQRAVLAALALDLGRPVSTDRLVDILWDERPPEQAVKTLQVYVSDGNPPSGVASGYIWFDVMALLVASRLRRRRREPEPRHLLLGLAEGCGELSRRGRSAPP